MQEEEKRLGRRLLLLMHKLFPMIREMQMLEMRMRRMGKDCRRWGAASDAIAEEGGRWTRIRTTGSSCTSDVHYEDGEEGKHST